VFGANGRINRAKYWRSVLIYICTGLVTTIILFTAVGIAAPPFIIEVVVELFPWLLWDFSFTTERLHDREDRVVAPCVLCAAKRAHSIDEARKACRNHNHGVAIHPGAGGVCADDLEIC